MIEKTKQLRVLTLVAGCVVVVLPVFLCGCESRKNIDIGKDTTVYRKEALEHEIEGRYVEAIASYKKAIALKPDYAEAYRDMGRAYNKLGRYIEAITACKKSIAIDPDDGAAYSFMGYAYEGLKENTKALAAYTKAIASDKKARAAYNNKKTIDACKKAIALDPNCVRTYKRMGDAYRALERYTDAIAAYKKVVAIRPDHANAYVFMGFAYKELKQNALAVSAFEKAIALQPTGKAADRARKAIQRLRGQLAD